MKQIFVQIAAYRDPQLPFTLKDLLEKAKHPTRLRVCIIQQDTTENLEKMLQMVGDEYSTDLNLSIVLDQCLWTQSKGACWARARSNSKWGGEQYMLQVDSHTRFVRDWDEKVENMWLSLDDPKAILTGYPPEFHPDKPEDQWVKHPQLCNVVCFHGRYPYSLPKMIPNWQSLTKPIKAVHISAGFIFGPGKLCQQVHYDRAMYFCGEETAMTVRYFTHGYNLYHPHRVLLWHYYTRPEGDKHWDNHLEWSDLDIVSRQRLDTLLGRRADDLGSCTLGKERNLADFIAYSGIDFNRCLVHPDTSKGFEPPVVNTPERWADAQVEFSQTLTWNFEEIPQHDSTDVKFWALIVKDTHDVELYRWDILQSEHPHIISGKQNTVDVKFTHCAHQQIGDIVIWPYTHHSQWTLSPYRKKLEYSK